MEYPVSPFGAKMLFQFPGIGLGFFPCLNLPLKRYASHLLGSHPRRM
jgi:hypothetical protein